MITENRSSNKVLVMIIAILLIANIATLALFLTGRHEGKNDRDDRKNGMRNYLQQELAFSKEQMAAFDSIKSSHRTQMKAMFDGLRAEKQQTLKNLGVNQFSDSAIVIAADAAASQQKQLETKFLSHLRDVRGLCNPAQLVKFDTGFYKIMARPAPDDKKKEK